MTTINQLQPPIELRERERERQTDRQTERGRETETDRGREEYIRFIEITFC